MSLGRAAVAPAPLKAGPGPVGRPELVGGGSDTAAAPGQVARPGPRGAIAYVDPGNIVADLQAAGRDGYRLLWVVVVAKRAGRFSSSCRAPT